MRDTAAIGPEYWLNTALVGQDPAVGLPIVEIRTTLEAVSAGFLYQWGSESTIVEVRVRFYTDPETEMLGTADRRIRPT